jgi:hypothetical protein
MSLSHAVSGGAILNFQGRYSFALSEAVAQGALRPLRNSYDQDA